MSQHQKSNSRLGWTFEEQAIVKDMYQAKGVQSWTQIASFISNRANGVKRSSKQCRQRYNNYIKLQSEALEQEWTNEENSKLFLIYLEKGSRWAEIAKEFSGRSQNFLKNRFYGSLRKSMNTMNRLCIQKKKKIRPIKYQTLAKILQIKEAAEQNKDQKHFQKYEFCERIRIDITMTAENPDGITLQKAENIIERAHKFNVLTRFQNMVKNRKLAKLNCQIKSKNTSAGIKINTSESQKMFQLQSLQSFNILQQNKQSRFFSVLTQNRQLDFEHNLLLIPSINNFDNVQISNIFIEDEEYKNLGEKQLENTEDHFQF